MMNYPGCFDSEEELAERAEVAFPQVLAILGH